MEFLTLPEPAAGLWAANRSIVHAIPPEMFGQRGRNTPATCCRTTTATSSTSSAAPPEAVAAGRVKIACEHGFPDISTFRPDPAYGHAIATVDGQLQKVLFSHQILCGKLERVDHLLVRHAFDVLTAVDEDPTGMVSQQRAAFIESVWRKAGGMLADNFHDAIRGAGRSVGTGLGRRTR